MLSDEPSRSVKLGAKQDFRCFVPQCDNFMSVGAKRETKSPGQSKVSYLEKPILVDQEVLRLHVPVEDPVSMAKGNALQHLAEEALDSLWLQPRVPWQAIQQLLLRLKVIKSSLKRLGLLSW